VDRGISASPPSYTGTASSDDDLDRGKRAAVRNAKAATTDAITAAVSAVQANAAADLAACKAIAAARVVSGEDSMFFPTQLSAEAMMMMSQGTLGGYSVGSASGSAPGSLYGVPVAQLGYPYRNSGSVSPHAPGHVIAQRLTRSRASFRNSPVQVMVNGEIVGGDSVGSSSLRGGGAPSGMSTPSSPPPSPPPSVMSSHSNTYLVESGLHVVRRTESGGGSGSPPDRVFLTSSSQESPTLSIIQPGVSGSTYKQSEYENFVAAHRCGYPRPDNFASVNPYSSYPMAQRVAANCGTNTSSHPSTVALPAMSQSLDENGRSYCSASPQQDVAILTSGGSDSRNPGGSGGNDHGDGRSVRFALTDSVVSPAPPTESELVPRTETDILPLSQRTGQHGDVHLQPQQTRQRKQGYAHRPVKQGEARNIGSLVSGRNDSLDSSSKPGVGFARSAIGLSEGVDGVDSRQEDPFIINIPGPCSGPVKPPPKSKLLANMPGHSTARRMLRNRGNAIHPKRYTQFHSLREPKVCLKVMTKVLTDYGCTQISSKKSRSSPDSYRVKCAAVKDKQPTVASIEIFRVDGDLTAISFKKRSSVDSKRFIALYEDVFKLFCSYDESSADDGISASDDFDFGLASGKAGSHSSTIA
jgi:hypothetical protein